jgi:hypothetical protein
MKNFLFTTIIFSMTILTSCKKFVEIDPPKNLIISETVFERDETAISTLTGIYGRMVNDGSLPYNVSLYCGLSSDELKCYSISLNLVQAYTNSLNSISGTVPNFWSFWYNHIYQANAVWEGCNHSTSLSPAVKKQLMAEALFIRAYCYFYLVNLYGNVPLIISTDYTKNSTAVNASKDQVYAQIINDLGNAEANLNPNYVALNSISSTIDRIRPNQDSATALLARVYLYNKNYSLAEQEATKVINHTSKYTLASIANAFLRTSSEAIWQLAATSPATNNTWEGQNYILTAKPSSSLSVNATISDQLYNSFEAGDLRKSNWIGKFTDVSTTPTVSYNFPYKYKIRNNNTTFTEYTTPLRLSEQYLIRAEARAQQEKIEPAKDDLDMIRTRAGLGNTSAADKPSLITAILHERQLEFFTEYGHRWMDLKRTGTVDAVMTTYAPIKGGIWSSYKQLWPIPATEIQNDLQLVQNPGYN